ncbi:MAG: hypothetical protein PHV02_21110 [Rhodocyclaceae bacterium]|nr:hypothetical protein [Rhodocyclaceae bacterium]
MLIQDRQALSAISTPMRSGVLREFVMRQDRLARDERIDLPEIQESYRVSFSESARAAVAGDFRNSDQSSMAFAALESRPQLRAYQAISAL